MGPRLAAGGNACYPIGVRRYRLSVLVERDEDGLLVGTIPALKGCRTQGRTLAELEERLAEAAKVCLEAGERPPKSNRFVGAHQIEVRA